MLDAEDSRFQRLLELSRDAAGAWLNPLVRYGAADMAKARGWVPVNPHHVF